MMILPNLSRSQLLDNLRNIWGKKPVLSSRIKLYVHAHAHHYVNVDVCVDVVVSLNLAVEVCF